MGNRLADLQLYAQVKAEGQLFFYKPYPKQQEFHARPERERTLCAGNQLGKTLCCSAEIAMHLTGEYPDDWKGRRIDHACRGWVAGVTGESTRDNPQRLLLGPVGQFGTGQIPKHTLVRTMLARGIPDAVETVQVKHKSGGISQIAFKAYSDGREKWQGETLDFVWFDEEPPEDIYIEGLTRTNATGGFVMLSFTPLLGMSAVVFRFMKQHPDRAFINMTIEDAYHYTAQQRATIIESYPEHEREARAKGIPMMGEGRVFPVAEEVIREKQPELPAHWKQIIGMDMGWEHPTAAVHLAWDADADCVHVINAYRVNREIPAVHAMAIKAWGDWIPVAWPHDAIARDKGSGVQLADLYKKAGLKMLSERAQFPDDRGNGVEAGVIEMLQRMRTQRLKVAAHLEPWFEEFRMYHRKDGMIVKEREDLLCATRYALMMLRYAKPEGDQPPKYDRYDTRKSKPIRSWMTA